MGLVVFLATVGALTIYAFHTVFDAPGWGFLAALVLFILGMTTSDRAPPAEPNGVSSVQSNERAGRETALPFRTSRAALAAGLAMIVGIGLGWLLRDVRGEAGPAGSFVNVQDSRLLATPPLKAALETIPSSDTPVSLGRGKHAQFRAKMTFQNERHSFCRQYELALGGHERMGGVACRIPGGDWSVALHSFLPPASLGKTVPASAGQNAALDAAIGALIAGDPLVGEAETAIMRNGWRK